jgi:hypothetical protein
VASWVEDDARREALIYRDGPEVWRDLKLSLKQEVDVYVDAPTKELRRNNSSVLM